MPQSNSNLVTPQSGLVPPPNGAYQAGQNFGKNLWNNTGKVMSGAANFVGGLFNNGATNPPAPVTPATNTNTYTLNGKSFNAAGDPSSAPVTAAANYTPPPVAPTGTGVAPVAPVTPQNNVATNTYNGGVNGNGQTFPGYVSTLANTASAPTPPYTQNQTNSQTAQSGLINTVPQNSAAVQQAEQQLESIQNQELAASKTVGNTPGIGLNVQGGEQGLVASQYAGELANAQTALQNALTGNAQTQTAYNEAGGLANTAASNATAQQGTQQSGQATAAGLVAPTPANQYGEYLPASGATQGYGTGAGSTSGGAATAGAVGTQAQQGAAVQNMTGIMAQAQALTPNLESEITASGYNPASGVGAATTYANGVNQWLQNASGSPQYKNAANLISEIANKYSAILNQSGGTPTSVSQIQEQIINGLASGQQIETIIGDLQNNAQTSIDALNKASQNNSVTGSSAAGSNNTVSVGGSTYVKGPNGWTVQ